MKTFREAVLTKEFTLIGQLRLHRETDRGGVMQQARCLAPVVDAVAVTDNPYGTLHMAGLAVASLLLDDGIDPVVQLASRDRNRLALQSELLGAAALGVTSLILQRGDKLPKEHHPKTRQVFDIGAKKMLLMGKELSRYRAQQNEPELFLGTISTVFDPTPDWNPTELSAKADAGARFLQTQVCFDMALLRRYVARLIAARIIHRYHVVVSVPVLPSVEAARWLFENLRSTVMPEDVLKRFERAKDPEREGIALCAELLRELSRMPGIGGANLVTPGNAELIPAAIEAAGLGLRETAERSVP